MRSPFEQITLKLSRKISTSTTTSLVADNDKGLPLSSKSNDCNDDNKNKSKKLANEQIKGVLKEVMYNSMAQATIKLFQTPYKELKILLAIFVLITISSRCLFSFKNVYNI
jgi:hypothetical protein